jgi:heme oxygenase
MQVLLRGRLDRGGYALLLRNLEPIYGALERGMAGIDLAPLDAPRRAALQRAGALAADLAVWHGPGWRDELPLLPSARAYAAHLDALAAAWPEGLAAHAYVRYLGDLSGGQVVARVVTKHLRPAPGHGLAFYDFGGEATSAALALALRAAIDRLGRAPRVGDALVDEACAGFARHGDLFDELERARQPA